MSAEKSGWDVESQIELLPQTPIPLPSNMNHSTTSFQIQELMSDDKASLVEWKKCVVCGNRVSIML